MVDKYTLRPIDPMGFFTFRFVMENISQLFVTRTSFFMKSGLKSRPGFACRFRPIEVGLKKHWFFKWVTFLMLFVAKQIHPVQ